MDPFFHTGLSISDSLKSVRKSVLIYETIILGTMDAVILRQEMIDRMHFIFKNTVQTGHCLAQLPLVMMKAIHMKRFGVETVTWQWLANI